MSDIAWNEPDDLRNRLKLLNSSIDKDTMKDVLETAHRETTTRVGTHIREKLEPTRRDQQDFHLAFSAIKTGIGASGILTLEVNDEDDGYTSASNFDVTSPNREGVKISFTDSFFDDELDGKMYRMSVEYVPTVFEDLELALAMDEVLRLTVVQTQGDDAQQMQDTWAERVDRLTKEINRKAANLYDDEAGELTAQRQRRSDWR